MPVDGNRLARVFIWKEGVAPDLSYARQILSVVNPEAAKAVEEDNPPIRLYAVDPPWPADPWARAISDLQADTPPDAGSNWTDPSRFDLAGWQGTDRRTGEHLFVVTAYSRAAASLPAEEAAFQGEGLSAPTVQAAPTGQGPGQGSVAQVPYNPYRPTGPLAWPPEGLQTGPLPQSPYQPPYNYSYSPMLSGPLGASGADSSTAHAALLDSYQPFYAGFGPRIVAGLIDFFFMSIFQVGTLAALIVMSNSDPPPNFVSWLTSYGLIACLAAATFSAYHVVQWSIWGQTLGKKLMGLKVVSSDGSVPGWGRSLLRMLGYFFSLSLGGWGVVMIALDPRRQGLHDKIAETFVVPEKAAVPAPAGLPGYPLPGATPKQEQPSFGMQAPARRQVPALGMANVAVAPPYNPVQINAGEEEAGSFDRQGRGDASMGRSQEAANAPTYSEGGPRDTLLSTVPNMPTTPNMQPEAGGNTIPNLGGLASSSLSEAMVTQPPTTFTTSITPTVPTAPTAPTAPTTSTSPVEQPSNTVQARSLFKTGLAEMEAGVRPSLHGYKVEPGLARAAAVSFRQALELVPGSVVYRYFYAIALRYSEGFEVAISELRRVLEQDPTHYEARQQVAYGPRWHDAFAYPAWVSPAPVERNAPLPEPIAALLPPGPQAATRLVLLREGGMKVAAFLSRTPRSAWTISPTAEMPAHMEITLSRTPSGPIIALYIVVRDDDQNPYIGETFLNPHDPGLPSDDACQLGQNMMEQLARQDRTYLIFSDEEGKLLLSRKLVFDATTQVSTARLLYEVQTLPPQVMDQDRFRQAAQWHMEHFSLDQVK